MGERFNSFINSLNDHEFAVFLYYQREGLLRNNEEVVRNEINTRKLTTNDLETYATTKLSYKENGYCCVQCGSNKFFAEKDIEYANGDHFTREIEVTTQRCMLCNHNPSKSEEKNIFKRIKLFFVRDHTKTKRIIKSSDWFRDYIEPDHRK